MIALDVKRFLPLYTFKAEIDRHVRDLASGSLASMRFASRGRGACNAPPNASRMACRLQDRSSSRSR
jgi:hypothetical protein